MTVVSYPQLFAALLQKTAGIRDDASLSLPELLDLDAEPNSVYLGADGRLRFKRIDGGVDALSSRDLVSATLSVVGVAYGYAEIVIAAPGTLPTDRVKADLVGLLDAENDIEAISDCNLRLFAAPEVDQIRFVLTGAGPFVGPFRNVSSDLRQVFSGIYVVMLRDRCCWTN